MLFFTFKITIFKQNKQVIATKNNLGDNVEDIITLNNISKQYSIGKQKLTALKNIYLTVKKGDFLAITGESGSGKSTLMNILGFLDSPDNGQYLFNGKSSADFSEGQLSKIRGRKIGFIFQSFHLLPNLTAYQNVELPLIYNRVPKKQRATLCQNALAKVGLANRTDHKPSQLSGGQKQRVAIARAIALSPPLILADEPTGNLDPASSKEILNILKSLNLEGTTVIIITHDNLVALNAKSRVNIVGGELK